MQTLKLSPGRIGWIVLLCLLGLVAPRTGVNPPVEARPSAENESSEIPLRTQPAKQLAKSRATSLKPDEDLFVSGALPRLSVELSRSEMSKLRKYRWQWGADDRYQIRFGLSLTFNSEWWDGP